MSNKQDFQQPSTSIWTDSKRRNSSRSEGPQDHHSVVDGPEELTLPDVSTLINDKPAATLLGQKSVTQSEEVSEDQTQEKDKAEDNRSDVFGVGPHPDKQKERATSAVRQKSSEADKLQPTSEASNQKLEGSSETMREKSATLAAGFVGFTVVGGVIVVWWYFDNNSQPPQRLGGIDESVVRERGLGWTLGELGRILNDYGQGTAENIRGVSDYLTGTIFRSDSSSLESEEDESDMPWRGVPHIDDERWTHIESRHVTGTVTREKNDLFPPETTRDELEDVAEEVVESGTRVSDDPSGRFQSFEKRVVVNGQRDRVRVVVDTATNGRIHTMYPVRSE